MAIMCGGSRIYQLTSYLHLIEKHLCFRDKLRVSLIFFCVVLLFIVLSLLDENGYTLCFYRLSHFLCIAVSMKGRGCVIGNISY